MRPKYGTMLELPIPNGGGEAKGKVADEISKAFGSFSSSKRSFRLLQQHSLVLAGRLVQSQMEA